MYTKLIDTVSNIVNTYGIGILSDNKFWSILTDSYNFSSDYTLRDEFKQCIANRNVSTLISLQGNKAKTLKFIKSCVYNHSAQNNSIETAACLFSIAIAIGSCDISDYNNLFGNKSQTPAPKPKSNPQTKPQSKSKRKQSKNNSNFGVNVGIILSTIWGISFLVGGTLFYGFFLYDKWWMFFVVLLMGIAQLSFCAYCLNFIEQFSSNWNLSIKGKAISCYIPIVVGFFLNGLIPILLCFDSIRAWAYRFFTDDFMPIERHEIYEIIRGLIPGPGAFSIILTLIFLFCIFACGLGIYSNDWNVNQMRIGFQKKPMLIVSCIIVFLYVILFSIHPIKRAVQEYHYNRAQKAFLIEQEKIFEKNDSLRSARANITQDLSFKGIKLGIYFDTAIGIANNLDDFQKSFGSPSTYEITISNPNEIFKTIIDASKSSTEYSVPIDSIKLPANKYIGKFYSGNTKLDNNNVYLRIFENQGLVVAIVVQESDYSYRSFSDFEEILALYTAKYGTPEIERDSTSFHKRYEYSVMSNSDRYFWNFKNGVIRLTPNNIVYLSSDFIKKVSLNYERERVRIYTETRRYNDSIRVVQLRLDSIRRAEEIADSIKRVRNHQNAINEI